MIRIRGLLQSFQAKVIIKVVIKVLGNMNICWPD